MRGRTQSLVARVGGGGGGKGGRCVPWCAARKPWLLTPPTACPSLSLAPLWPVLRPRLRALVEPHRRLPQRLLARPHAQHITGALRAPAAAVTQAVRPRRRCRARVSFAHCLSVVAAAAAREVPPRRCRLRGAARPLRGAGGHGAEREAARPLKGAGGLWRRRAGLLCLLLPCACVYFMCAPCLPPPSPFPAPAPPHCCSRSRPSLRCPARRRPPAGASLSAPRCL